MAKKSLEEIRAEAAANAEKNNIEYHPEVTEVKGYTPNIKESTESRQSILKLIGECDVTHTAIKENGKKTSAKKAGVKSRFSLDDSVLLTSFGKGNEAIIEKKVKEGNITDISTHEAYSVREKGRQFAVKGRKAGHTDNPEYFGKKKAEKISEKEAAVSGKSIDECKQKIPRIIPKTDMIGCKDVLEKKYFGKTFEDNIHIQLIYNILDIEKILCVYVNNIVYEINNIRRSDDAESYDFIGYMSLRNTYNEFCNPDRKKLDPKAYKNVTNSHKIFESLLENKRLAYFGSAFYEVGSDTKAAIKNTPPKPDSDIYYMLALLGTVRQKLVHGDKGGYKHNDVIYRLADFNEEKSKYVLEMLDHTYSERIKSLNDGFIDKAQKNIVIYLNAIGESNADYYRKKEIVADYYDFIVKKSYKNIGFSFKKLREIILTYSDAKVMSEHKYDTVRQKLNQLFDFTIFEYYKNNPKQVDYIVSELRCAEGDEKEKIYAQEAERLWKNIRGAMLNKILPNLHGKEIRKIEADNDIDTEMIKDCFITSSVDPFTKFIYMLTLFLDGKEINDLLTTLINKFDNIASFNKVIKETFNELPLVDDYKIFEKADVIGRELREVNSFARMNVPNPSAKKYLFADAAKILGTDDDEKQLEYYFEYLLDKNKGKKKPNGKKDNGLRNFIASNVIESSRFKYIIKFSDPAKARKLACNRYVVEFVLTRLPKDQIKRYYKACGGKSDVTEDEMQEFLCGIITGMNFSKFVNVNQEEKGNNTDKAYKIGAISLYLTVLYQITKNLVNINSRYFMAFHALQRDSDLMGIRALGKNKDDSKYTAVTEKFVKEERLNKRACKYLEINLKNSDKDAIFLFRNTVEHMGVVRNADAYINNVNRFTSYFELYHSIMHLYLAKKHENPTHSKTIEYYGAVNKYHFYCKDFVKALNAPFGYNLARFKNLSIDGLFDYNDERVKRISNISAEDGGKEYRV